MINLKHFETVLNLVRECDWSDRGKQIALENAYGQTVGLNKSWRVIGITNACVEALRSVDYDWNIVKPVRSHVYQRRNTFITAIHSDMTTQEIFDYIWERDVCIISLRSENKDDGSLTNEHPIDQSLGLFPSQNVGVRLKKNIEIKWLRETFGWSRSDQSFT